MTKDVRVSVAMATYNGERFLQEQLDSLARQTLLPYELVVCDDGSTDSTLEILDRFAASAPFPVRVFRNPFRLGYGFNFLGALSRCRGDLVAFCDQDDIWHERKLQVCAEAMTDPSVALVSHSADVLTGQLPRGTWRYPDHSPTVWRSYRDLPIHRWAVPGFSVVLRRAVLMRVRIPPYDAAIASSCAHDAWATFAALSCGSVVLLRDVLASYRLHGGNASLRTPAFGLRRLAPDAATLERIAKSGEGSALFLRYAASFCEDPARRIFYSWAQQSEHIQSLYRNRARLHRAAGRRWAAIKMLLGMVATGNYGPRRLGAKALARDVFLATFWSASLSDGRPADRVSAAQNSR